MQSVRIKANPEISDAHTKYTSALNKVIEKCKENFRAGYSRRPEVSLNDKKSYGDSFSEISVQDFKSIMTSALRPLLEVYDPATVKKPVRMVGFQVDLFKYFGEFDVLFGRIKCID